MSLLRIAAALTVYGLVALTLAHAGEMNRARMPTKPAFGAPSSEAMPSVAIDASIGRDAGGLAPGRLGRTMDAALAADVTPTRGKVEEKLFATFARSVVLIVLPEGMGSGAVIDKDGTIITNNHVVAGFKSAAVIFKPTRTGANPRIAEAVEAKVLYVDEVADLAIIKVAKLPPNVKPFALGDHLKLRIGADVHAIGHPIGESWSYTKGVVSQIRPDYEWRYPGGPQHRGDVIQTQTPINPGNSGGPLLNDAGEIVGLNTFGDDRASTEIRRFAALRKDRRATETSTASETMPSAPLPAAQRSTPDCEVKKLESRRAERQDATGHMLDTDCDGVVDVILIVPDNAREPMTLLIDANQNLAVDAVYVDEDRDLKFDFVLFDVDEDGATDMIGVDLDPDLKPARFLATRA